MVKNPPANAGNTGDRGSITGSGRSPGVENGNPPQYSCLDNSMDRGTWQVSPRGCKESDMTEQLSTHAHDICSLLLQHTKYFHCPENPLCSARLSPYPPHQLPLGFLVSVVCLSHVI